MSFSVTGNSKCHLLCLNNSCLTVIIWPLLNCCILASGSLCCLFCTLRKSLVEGNNKVKSGSNMFRIHVGADVLSDMENDAPLLNHTYLFCNI